MAYREHNGKTVRYVGALKAHSGMPPVQERWLRKTATSIVGGQAIVELGVWQGVTLRALGRSTRGAHVYGIDPFGHPANDGSLPYGGKLRKKDKPRYTPANEAIARRVAGRYATIIRGFGADVAASWTGPKVGLLLHDAQHTAQAVREDLNAWAPHLLPSSWVAIDDIYMADTLDAVLDFFPDYTLVGERMAVARWN